MLKRAFLLIGILALIFTMFLFVPNENKQEHFVLNYALDSTELALLQDGDIILRHGYGLVSDGIVDLFNEKYDISHCAILVKSDEGFQVIHSVSQSLSDFDGVQKVSLPTFIKDSKKNSIIVGRFKYPLGFKGKEISSKAQEFLSLKIPFDHDFNLNDSTKFYCSELVWRAIFDSHNVDIFQGKRNPKIDLIKFSVFWDTTKFDIIINHHLKKKT